MDITKTNPNNDEVPAGYTKGTFTVDEKDCEGDESYALKPPGVVEAFPPPGPAGPFIAVAGS